MIVQPEDGRPVNCHASAWDFFNREDYRIKMCTQVNMSDLITIHHEMGHIQYYMHYSKQPAIYRTGANPGFHEAIGDTIALAVSTPNHLKGIGLLPPTFIYTEQSKMNYLYTQALSKIAFLPFGYLIDMWRWSVFNGTTPSNRYNTDWWMLRTKYQGIAPPDGPRSEDYFDPGAKSHINDNTEYLRYFFSFIAQFQFYKAMCTKAGHNGPLNECDFYTNREAGQLLGNMLDQGNSKPWRQLMREMTGSPELDASAIVEYFQPLTDWLHAENVKNNECYGWGAEWPAEYIPLDHQNRCSDRTDSSPSTTTTISPTIVTDITLTAVTMTTTVAAPATTTAVPATNPITTAPTTTTAKGASIIRLTVQVLLIALFTSLLL